MEVHQHSHSPRRKWTHYFWEFLMLFLAVFCGFLAEWQLEHTIEHKREKQFMRSMTEDLKKDVEAMDRHMTTVSRQQAGFDTLATILHKESFDKAAVRKMYDLQRRYLYFQPVRLVDRTEQQLKNSGGMRLIRNKKVADSIIQYWSIAVLFDKSMINLEEYRKETKDYSFLLFHSKYYKDGGSFVFDQFNGDPELITMNPEIIAGFVNRIWHIKDIMKHVHFPRVKRQQEFARNLIGLIKKEYHLLD